MDSHLEKYSWISFSLSPYTKINFRFLQHLNIINENLKMFEESIQDFLLGIRMVLQKSSEKRLDKHYLNKKMKIKVF